MTSEACDMLVEDLNQVPNEQDDNVDVATAEIDPFGHGHPDCEPHIVSHHLHHAACSLDFGMSTVFEILNDDDINNQFPPSGNK